MAPRWKSSGKSPPQQHASGGQVSSGGDTRPREGMDGYPIASSSMSGHAPSVISVEIPSSNFIDMPSFHNINSGADSRAPDELEQDASGGLGSLGEDFLFSLQAGGAGAGTGGQPVELLLLDEYDQHPPSTASSSASAASFGTSHSHSHMQAHPQQPPFLRNHSYDESYHHQHHLHQHHQQQQQQHLHGQHHRLAGTTMSIPGDTAGTSIYTHHFPDEPAPALPPKGDMPPPASTASNSVSLTAPATTNSIVSVSTTSAGSSTSLTSHSFVPDPRARGGFKPLVDNTGQAITRKLAPSCDNCRVRKIKCIRPDVVAKDTRCQQCRTQNSECSYDYVPKRPGPRQKRATSQSSTASQLSATSSPASLSAVRRSPAPYAALPTPVLPPRSSSHRGVGAPTSSAASVRSSRSGSTARSERSDSNASHHSRPPSLHLPSSGASSFSNGTLATPMTTAAEWLDSRSSGALHATGANAGPYAIPGTPTGHPIGYPGTTANFYRHQSSASSSSSIGTPSSVSSSLCSSDAGFPSSSVGHHSTGAGSGAGAVASAAHAIYGFAQQTGPQQPLPLQDGQQRGRTPNGAAGGGDGRQDEEDPDGNEGQRGMPAVGGAGGAGGIFGAEAMVAAARAAAMRQMQHGNGMYGLGASSAALQLQTLQLGGAAGATTLNMDAIDEHAQWSPNGTWSSWPHGHDPAQLAALAAAGVFGNNPFGLGGSSGFLLSPNESTTSLLFGAAGRLGSTGHSADWNHSHPNGGGNAGAGPMNWTGSPRDSYANFTALPNSSSHTVLGIAPPMFPPGFSFAASQQSLLSNFSQTSLQSLVMPGSPSGELSGGPNSADTSSSGPGVGLGAGAGGKDTGSASPRSLGHALHFASTNGASGGTNTQSGNDGGGNGSLASAAKLGAGCLEDVDERSLFAKIFAAQLYPLAAIVPNDKLLADFEARRDAIDPDWFALALSFAACVLVRSVSCATPSAAAIAEYVPLHRKFHATSQTLQPKQYAQLSQTHVATFYCDYLYAISLGATEAAKTKLVETIRLLPRFLAQDEQRKAQRHQAGNSSGDIVSPKKVFFAFLAADFANAVLEDDPLNFRPEDILHIQPPPKSMSSDDPFDFHFFSRLTVLGFDLLVQIQRERKQLQCTPQGVAEMQYRLKQAESQLSELLAEITASSRNGVGTASVASAMASTLYTIQEAAIRYLLQTYSAIQLHAVGVCRSRGVQIEMEGEQELRQQVSSAVIHILTSLRSLALPLIAACNQPAVTMCKFLVYNLTSKLSPEHHLQMPLLVFFRELQAFSHFVQGL